MSQGRAEWQGTIGGGAKLMSVLKEGKVLSIYLHYIRIRRVKVKRGKYSLYLCYIRIRRVKGKQMKGVQCEQYLQFLQKANHKQDICYIV